ncbi:hypothetical protein HXX76_002346 [Chlamydomonas incerta]|uniref:Uncharacterized protein n=1 Tax=Chlamydomonas incerta TaxID=51695 RepID=A0A835W904_CHLIN|nr:hypothetical protein HXX76_002346 [Chlamydomonas incerta]|eukprot:KAG2442259.1 hypothetical protein HXX76_002346 [Chlamydomonas incerta]
MPPRKKRKDAAAAVFTPSANAAGGGDAPSAPGQEPHEGYGAAADVATNTLAPATAAAAGAAADTVQAGAAAADAGAKADGGGGDIYTELMLADLATRRENSRRPNTLAACMAQYRRLESVLGAMQQHGRRCTDAEAEQLGQLAVTAAESAALPITSCCCS